MRELFPKSATTLGHVEQAFWRVPLFTKGVVASSFEVILAGQSKHSSIGTPASLVLDAVLSFCRVKKLGEGCGCVGTLVNIVTETAIVSFHTLPVLFSLPTISQSSLFTLFFPLILDTAFLS